jgi:hypothetical protein
LRIHGRRAVMSGGWTLSGENAAMRTKKPHPAMVVARMGRLQ